MITHPLFLIALVAVAVPIAVHLFNFRRYRKVYFSNVDALSEIRQETRRQSELVRYLVLACRVLAIVCLVLAFAQPVLPGKNSQMRAGGTAVSIYLDNSFSMDNTNSEGTLLEMGRTKVREIVAAYRPDDRFQLLTNEASGSQFRWLSRDELLIALDEVQSAPATVMLSEVGRRQYDFLRRSNAANLHCYVVSDFQKSTADLDQWPSDTSMQTTMLALSGTSVGNLYIDSVALNAPAYYPGNTVAVTAFLRNTGGEDLEQVQVRLFADGAQRAIATADVPSQGKAEVVINTSIPKDLSAEGHPLGLNCHLEITDYPVTFDDRFYFSINVNSRIRVLSVGNDNVFLDRLFADDSSVTYTKVAENRIDYSSLNDNNLIILNSPKSIPSGLAQALSSWIEEGGTLLVIPPDHADESHNAALALFHAPQLGAWVGQKSMVSNIDFDNPLYRNVFGSKADDIEKPAVLGRYQLQVGNGAVRTSLMTMADGSDFLTHTPCGSGSLYLMASPLDERYTDFMRQALFVASFYNMALYSRQMGSPYHLLGSSELIPLCNTYEMPHLTDGASLDVLPDLRQASGRTYIVPRGHVREAGTYVLGEGPVMEYLSFNYSRRESVMDCYAPSEVASLIDDYHLAECSVVPNAQKSMESYIRHQRDARPLWPIFVIGALLFLLAEVLLLRFHHRSTTKTDI